MYGKFFSYHPSTQNKSTHSLSLCYTTQKEYSMTGKELKRLREKLGLTLAMAAKQLDVSIATWCRWQNADVVPANRVKYFLMLNDERIKSRDGRL